MVPAPIHPYSRSSRLLYPVASFIVHNVPKLFSRADGGGELTPTVAVHSFAKRKLDSEHIAFAVLIPVLVLLSGLFAGLTLGYMSLDETQLQVLSISGTPKQKEYANKIKPIRKNGHLLLITLILANMIANETLPVVADPILGGGVQSVVVSTVLIVIFSEIIPQSLCTRYGLAIGAHMAWLVRILILVLGVVSWPVAKLLEITLGSHHGIMYRRAELKELIALHSSTGELGGDLKKDTVTIIGATLDLQEKVVRQAMTPIADVFMLSIDSVLDYDTMKKICDTGHSRVPVYEEIEIPVVNNTPITMMPLDTVKADDKSPIEKENPRSGVKIVKKIVGILLVKQCVLLDPQDATPLRKLQLNRVPFIPNNEPLLSLLDRFQEGRSHMAIVSRFSEEKAETVKAEVKKGLTQRMKDRVMGDSGSDSSGSEDDSSDKDNTLRGDTKWKTWRKHKKAKSSTKDIEMGDVAEETATNKQNVMTVGFAGREQNMPADAVLAKEGANEFLQSLDPAVLPLGIITLEDVLEELIGEEIYDEFDVQGLSHLTSYTSPTGKRKGPRPSAATAVSHDASTIQESNVPAINVTPSTADNGPAPADMAPARITLAPSLGALVQHRWIRGVEARSRSSSRNVSRAPQRTRSVDDGQGQGRHIPDANEKVGPDIGVEYERKAE